ncbi:MAG TPA: glycosyltransferase family 39 protein [Acidimicrobiales bacterium]|nr:glycosyltransferase family 39 protein [Acidimicrobiales bacterium]
MTARRFTIVLVTIVLVGVGLRVGFLAAAAKPLPEPGDAMAYHLLAEGLAGGDGYVRPYDRVEGRIIPTAEYGPAYPFVLSVATRAGVDTTWGQRYLGAVLGGLSIALTGFAGRRIASSLAGLVASALLAASPLVVQHDTALLTEGLAVVAAAALLLAAASHVDRPGPLAAAGVGAIIGAAALVRADALLLVPLVGVPVVVAATFRRQGGRAAAVHGAAVVAGVVVIAAPWGVRNASRLDANVGLSTNTATVIAGANCDDTYDGSLLGYWRFGPGCFEGYSTEDLVASGEAAVARSHMDRGLSYIGDNLGRLPSVVGARVLRVWGAWDVDQLAFLAGLEGKSARWERWGIVAGWFTSLLAIVGIARIAIGRVRRPVMAMLLAGPLVAVTVSAALTYGNVRFRAGAEPALAVAAAIAITRLAGRLRARLT